MTSEREALIEWLGGHDYSHWCTWTFGKRWPDGPTASSVRRHCVRFLEARTDVGPWFLVIEKGTSHQLRCHGHGLIGPRHLGERVLSGDCWRDWGKRYGRNTVDPLRSDTGGLILYVTKYITKTAERSLADLTWDIGVNS